MCLFMPFIYVFVCVLYFYVCLCPSFMCLYVSFISMFVCVLHFYVCLCPSFLCLFVPFIQSYHCLQIALLHTSRHNSITFIQPNGKIFLNLHNTTHKYSLSLPLTILLAALFTCTLHQLHYSGIMPNCASRVFIERHILISSTFYCHSICQKLSTFL